MNTRTINDGGPAFPCEVGPMSDGYTFQTGDSKWQQPGLTLRDYFAAKAMQSMCEEVSRYDQFTTCASDAYKLADAMIKARSV